MGLVLIGSFVLLASFSAWRSRPAPLSETYPSSDALARAVIAAFQARDAHRLRGLALTEDEFRSHVWPKLPASRPDRNVPFDFAWGMLHQNSEGHLRQTLSQFEGKPLTLVRVEFAGETTAYGSAAVHRDTRLVVKDAAGKERVVRLFGSTIEQDGRYKVFSYVVE